MKTKSDILKWFKIFVTTTFALILGLVLAELGLRLFFALTNENIEIYRNFSFTRSPSIFLRDPILRHKLNPNAVGNAFTSDFQITYRINSLGLREKKLEATTKFKILFLGDSHTFGEGVMVENRFSDLIEKRHPNTYSINAGVPGYGINQMYLELKNRWINLNPNLVIISIISIDLYRAIFKHPITSTRQEQEPPPSQITRPLITKSYLYNVLKVKITIWKMWKKLKERDEQEWTEIKTKYTTHIAASREEIVQKKSFEIFSKMNQLLKRHQIDLLVMNISYEPIPWLANFFEQNKIKYLDASPILSDAQNITFKIDPHYNENGHRIIADILNNYLEHYLVWKKIEFKTSKARQHQDH